MHALWEIPWLELAITSIPSVRDVLLLYFLSPHPIHEQVEWVQEQLLQVQAEPHQQSQIYLSKLSSRYTNRTYRPKQRGLERRS